MQLNGIHANAMAHIYRLNGIQPTKWKAHSMRCARQKWSKWKENALRCWLLTAGCSCITKWLGVNGKILSIHWMAQCFFRMLCVYTNHSMNMNETSAACMLPLAIHMNHGFAIVCRYIRYQNDNNRLGCTKIEPS